MDLYKATRDLWTPDRVALSKAWATALKNGKGLIEDAAEKFREWAPLRFYVNVSDVGRAAEPGSRAVPFSLRYSGQEVARVRVGKRDHEVSLSVSGKEAAKNKEHFKVFSPTGTVPWNSQEARVFRESFRQLASDTPGRILEHAIESRILRQLEATSAVTKFGGTLGYVRHCGLGRHEFPLQYAVPISANTGVPKATKGSIDILVRHGHGRGARLSVWELKQKGVTAHALQQAYIYAVTFALMLRGAGGQDWYALLGFTGSLPKRLKIEAVAVVSRDREQAIEASVAKLAGSPLWLAKESTEISLHAALYEPKSLRMKWIDLPAPPVS